MLAWGSLRLGTGDHRFENQNDAESENHGIHRGHENRNWKRKMFPAKSRDDAAEVGQSASRLDEIGGYCEKDPRRDGDDSRQDKDDPTE